MDRRYYGLKALLLALAIGAAAYSGFAGLPRTASSLTRVHYGAAVTMQTALADATTKASRTFHDFVKRAECIAR